MGREIIIFLIGVLIGVGIGYFGESFVRPYVSVYSFSTVLTLSLNESSTVFSVGSSVSFKAQLDFNVPSELSSIGEQIRPYVLKDKPIALMFKTNDTEYWTVLSVKNTFYVSNYGEAVFSYFFYKAGTYDFKAVFEGDNLLKKSESQTVTVTVY
ncbi:MAG: Ig-like domain-containing protein [Candidatus Bathyarchaeota archaeon]